jgi:hypothetical protein
MIALAVVLYTYWVLRRTKTEKLLAEACRERMARVDLSTGLATDDAIAQAPVLTPLHRAVRDEVLAQLVVVPKYTEANQIVVGQKVVKVFKSWRPDIRGTHLRDATRVITNSVFVPTQVEIVESRLMAGYYDSPWKDWLFGGFAPAQRMRQLVRPSS